MAEARVDVYMLRDTFDVAARREARVDLLPRRSLPLRWSRLHMRALCVKHSAPHDAVTAS